jgi:hypothetical protein
VPLNVSLDPANERLIEEYKSLGFSTKTAMINEAELLLMKARARDIRAATRRQMLAAYAASKPDTMLAAIEGEHRPVDFDLPRTPPWRGDPEG